MKNLFVKICFYYMSKGLDILLKNDKDVRERLEIITDETKIKLDILGCSQTLILQKQGDRLLVVKNKNEIADLVITFKFFASLPKIVFGKVSVTDCYLNDEFFVNGELRYAVATLYAIEKFMAYLIPKKTYIKRYGHDVENVMSKSKMFSKLIFAKRGRV